MHLSEDEKLLGMPALDLEVLSCMHDLGLRPDVPHRRTADVLQALFDSGLCGIDDGYEVVQRLAGDWLMPLPLVDGHGNLGSLHEPAAQPIFNEVRLTRAGSMAVEAYRGDIPVLPIGLINGTLPWVLGLCFALWPDTGPDGRDRPYPRILRLRPGFDPVGLAAALNAFSQRGSAEPEVAALATRPWLGPFEAPTEPTSQLLETGEQTIQLTPRRNESEDWALPPAEVVLDLGGPLESVLREWIELTGDRTPDPPLLEQLTAPPTAP